MHVFKLRGMLEFGAVHRLLCRPAPVSFYVNVGPNLAPLVPQVPAGSTPYGRSLGAEDRRIWTYAAEHGYLLTSKDTDFYQHSLVHGAPPKAVWLRIGNASTSAMAALLRERYVVVRRFADDPDATFVPLSA